MLDKTFSPQDVEGRIYAQWEASGAFKAGRRPDAEPFCIMIPPPNITGRLHIGHALNNTLQDILVRFERMRGKDVLWQVGTDHAGIATQLIVERQLAERQMSRVAMGREKFLEAVWKWKDESGGAIIQQLRRLGASADWTRERFTMDEGLSRAVLKVFVELYNQGLIYKDTRLVNWDPRLQTAVSDLEVESIEVKGHLWYLKYPIENQPGRFITVATTRPETMFGDTAVAVHPDDERYRDLIGQHAILPFANRPIPIIADAHSDPEKGTGAVKITPGHDFNDFEVGKRHDLPLLNILNKDGTLNDAVPPAYRGLAVADARKMVVADLDALDLIDKVEPITHAVPHDEKTKTVVLEPFMTEQWYCNVKPLAEKAIKAVEDGRTTFTPENWANTYFSWLKNIHPWCISRQLWWGHQIPAWYGPKLGFGMPGLSHPQITAREIFVGTDDEDVRRQAEKHYGTEIVFIDDADEFQLAVDKFVIANPGDDAPWIGPVPLMRDTDVLDTWFSSALWPFSTLGWPDETAELKRYYPTSVLSTGFDIIFFWVARMMMMGIHFMDGEVPFQRVLIHTRVLDEQGAKMSKTKGNVVDPLTLIDQFGADALRFTLAFAAGLTRDMRIGPARVEPNRNFATKLWNAARFCEMNGCVTTEDFDPTSLREPVNRWIVMRTENATRQLTRALEELRFNEAAAAAYRFVYDVFCDWYLEIAKPVFNGTDDAAKTETRATAAWVRDNVLRLLHPFMPFITEELWAQTTAPGIPRATLLIEADWPQIAPISQSASYNSSAIELEWIIELVKGVRSIRSEMNVPPSAEIALLLKDASDATRERLVRQRNVILQLARLASAETADTLPKGSAQFVVGEATAGLPLGDVIDFAKERARLEKDLKKANDEIARFDSKLSNEQFVAKAPEEVLAEQREKRAEAAATAARLTEAVARLAE